MIGKMMMATGAILAVAIFLSIGGVFSSGIPLPVGVAGYIYQPDGEILETPVNVYATNLNTSETTVRQTQDGKFAIPVSARTGDKIKVWAEYNNLKASRILTADIHKTTNWCNLTLGVVENPPTPPYFLFIAPLALIGGGYVLEKRKH